LTIAICLKCGATKFGALTPCEACAHMPGTERDVIYSMALSDHYMDVAKLQELADLIKRGRQLQLPQAQEDMLRPAAREYLKMHAAIIERVNHGAAARKAFDGQTFGGPKREKAGQAGLCFQCWEVKPVFPMPCAVCGRRPRDELEFVYDMTTGQPVFFVMHEGGFLGGENLLCAFDRIGGHRNYGSDAALADEAIFVQRAVPVIEAELGVRLHEQFPEALKGQRAPPAAADDPNRAYKQHLVRMLAEMRAEFTQEDLANPTIRRLFQFTEDFKRFVVDGVRTDAESDRLVAELDWMKANPKVALPAEVFDSMRHIVRTEAPRAAARIARLAQAHYECAMGGGTPKAVEREIAAMRNEGLLTAEDAAGMQRTLRESDDNGAGERLRRLAAGEDASSVYGRKSWWQRLFG
jgi:hypothetical protein